LAAGTPIVHGLGVAGKRDRQALLEKEQTVDDQVRGAREPATEELRHRLVEVEEDRHAGQPDW
jgi:hypothetical protein